MKPKFSIVAICKNEARTIPRLTASLEEYKKRGGDLQMLDTGSTDGSADIARSLGWTVTEVGSKFIITIDEEIAKQINDMFVEEEDIIVKPGDTLFDYGSARNYVSSLAEENMICTLDCDEAYSTFNINALDELIEKGYTQFEYPFCFAHDQWGRPAVEFIQSKFYDRRKLKWNNYIHEVLQPIPGQIPNGVLLTKNIIYLEHWQEPAKEHRAKYLPGLALDCFEKQKNDRNSHYLGRELLWTNRPKSAIKELKRHVEMNAWPTERAQSMTFIADAYGMLGDIDNQIKWYAMSYKTEPNRREPLIKLAELFQRLNVPKAVAAYTRAAMELPYADYYANNKDHFESYPHALLYWAYGWMGKIPEAKEQILKALDWQPYNQNYIRDLKYYFQLPKISIIIPTLGRPDGLKKCLDSIKKLNYPEDKIEVITLEDKPRIGVPKRLKEGVELSTGDFIIYASNDVEFDPSSVALAYLEFERDDKLILLAFNTNTVLPDEGNICEHFMFRKEALDLIGGEIFDTEFHHVGVDNLLWAKCKALGGSKRSTLAKMKHNHFTQGAEMDETYKLGWSKVEEDRALLKKKLSEPLPTNNPGFGLEYKSPNITGWMTPGELNFLYKSAKKFKEVCEIGSWMGRSCHALLSACKGRVHSVDHYLGSADPLDTGHKDVYPDFMKNVGHFPNLVVHRKSSLEGVKDFEDGSLEMVFIDAGHQYQEVVDDIKAWKPKATKLLCGHDYQWPGVSQAVLDTIGRTYQTETIWHLDLTNRLHQLRDMIDNGKNFIFAKMGDGEMLAMLGAKGANCDGQEYSEELGQALCNAYCELGKHNALITKWKLGMDTEREGFERDFGIKCTEDHDLLLNRDLSPYIFNFWKAIKTSKRHKVFVGPKRLEGVIKFLNIDEFVEVPQSNAYSANPIINAKDIVLFSAGMASKVWMAELLKQNPNLTLIDCGSAFDPIFVGQTRTNQQPQEKLKQFYAEIL